MADDNSLRSYRTNDPHRRSLPEQQDSIQGSDPLAELARLIGQTDPLAEPSRPVPRVQQFAADDWRRHIERPSYETMRDPAPEQQDPYSMAAPANHDYREPHAHAHSGAPDPAEYRQDHYAAHDHAAHDERHHHGGVEPPEQDIYDDPPRKKRGNGLVTALVLIGCAILGTVGAYGYRSYTSGASPGQAPVIVADRAPNKVVPASTATETVPARSQERFPGAAGAGGNERLVSREEQPVALATGTTGSPRVVLPAPVPPQSPEAAPAASPPAAASQAAPPPAASAPSSSEPKRVRTVIIRSDGNETGGRAAPGETRSIPNARASAPPARGQQAAPPAPPARGMPLSLDPQGQAQAPISEPPRSQRVLTPPAPRAEAEPLTRPRRGWHRRRRTATTAVGAAMSCRCRHSAVKRTHRLHSGRCRPNIRNCAIGNRSSGALISAPRVPTTAPWSGRSAPRARPANSAAVSRLPADSALSSATEHAGLTLAGGTAKRPR